MEQLHATCVEIDGVGVLIRGPSGSGKSDLALRLLDGDARLVADDRVDLRMRGGCLMAMPPPAIAGKLEVRGLGIVDAAWLPEIRLSLLVELKPAETIERLPVPSSCQLEGVVLPRLELWPFEASACAKIRLAVRRAKIQL